jgi:hypothetical protein
MNTTRSLIRSTPVPVATTTAVSPAELRESTSFQQTRRWDHIFYLGMTGAAIVTVLVGFGPAYYFRSVSGAPSLPGPIHLHALVFSAWMVLLLIQICLVARGHVNMHRRLGALGAVVASGMVILGSMVAIARAQEGRGTGDIDMFVALAFALGDLVVFACCVAAGLWFRRQPETHKRLMLLASLGGLLPAPLARLPFVGARPLLMFAVLLLFLAAGPVYDLATRRRVHRAYLWGCVLTTASVPLRIMVGETEQWRRIVSLLLR